MYQQKRRQLHNNKIPQTNIQVIREGHQRLSDRRPAQFLNEEQPETKINSSTSFQNSTNRHSNKMVGLQYHSFHSANEADRLLDLSSASSSSFLSVKSCFGSFGTQKVKVPVSSLQEVQNLPGNTKIPLNSTSTPRSLSPEFVYPKQVLVEKHNPSQKGFAHSSSSFDANVIKGSPQNDLRNKTERKEFDLSGMFFTSAKPNPSEMVTFSDQTAENSMKSGALNSDCVGLDNKESSGKPSLDQKTRPVRIPQGSVATGKMLMQKKIPNSNNNVQITNFSALDSLAARKALLLKKTQNAQHPVRRTVPARAITFTNQSGDACEKKDVCHSCKEKPLLPDTISAVAAATAAALSTQPILSSQNKLESQLSLLLEKISALEQEAALKQKELENKTKTEKIADLESQLHQVTEERMKNLEALQKQLFGLQTRFLRVAGNSENMSGVQELKNLQPENQKPTETQDAYLNSSLNRSIGQELKNNPSMSSGYQTLSVTLDQQKSLTDDKESLGSQGYEHMDAVATNVKNIRTTKHFNINNSGKLNPSGMVHQHMAKNIYVPSVEKKPKVPDHKVSFSVKTHASSTSSKSKGNVQPKLGTDKGSSKNITQKKVSSVRNKVESQEEGVNKNVTNKHLKEKPSRSDTKSSSDTKQPYLVPDSSRYSVLKDFVSGRYSQQPYVIREMDSISKSATGRILNTSFTVADPIVEREDTTEEHFSKVETKRPELNKEIPLEKYLLQSPDKSLLFTQDKIYSGQQPSLPSAEVLAGQEILRKAQTSRMVLEANLQMAERDHEKDAVYGLVDNLYEGSPASHRLQLRRKVDQCIAKVQKDIQNELSQTESLNALPNKTKSQKSIGSFKGQKVLPEKTVNKVSVNKDKCRDSDYLAQVFGKAAYQNKRTTMKKPYMHFQNNPRAKSPRSKETVPVKGVQMRSAKTQTRQEKENNLKQNTFTQQSKTIDIDSKKYFFASSTTDAPNSVNLQHGHLGYMAVALREPRMDSGLKVPVSIRAGDSLTMAPEDQPKMVPARNVMVCNITVSDEEQVPKRRQALVKQTLPSVVIEGEQEMIQSYKDFLSDSKPSAEEAEKKKTSLCNVMNSDENLDEEVEARSDSSESIVSSSSEEEADVKEESLIILSGSNPKITGGKTWKTTTELVEKRTGEDILDSLHAQDFSSWVPFVPEADSPRELPVRHHLQDEALQWVEEEIISQILSHQSDQPPRLHSSGTFCEVVDDVPPNNTSKSDTNTLLHGGLQAPTNRPPPPYVGKALISQLVEELLVDKINEMLKDALDKNAHRPPVSDPTSPQNELSSISEKLVPSPETPEMTPDTSEKSLASPEPDVPLPQTPSASPEPLLEGRSSIAEHSLPNDSPDAKLERSFFHAALKQEINKLREEENFKVTHPEEEAAAAPSNLVTLVTPERTPSLTPIRVGSPVTPVSSPSFQPDLLNENSEGHAPIRTPSPSTFSQDGDEEAVDIRQDELQLTINPDDIPSIKEVTQEEETSRKQIEGAAVDAKQNINLLESLSPEETGSVSTTASESETIFESLSVGQWLLSKSEGQAADFGISEKAYRQILNDASTASTLRDTEDLFQDETTEITYSEGEVVYKSRVPPEKDPILELVSQMQSRNPLTLPDAFILQSNNEGKYAVHRSLGEFPLIESELYRAKDAPEKAQADHFLKPEQKSLKQQQRKLTEIFNSQPGSEEEEEVSEKEMYVPQKGARIIEVGKRVAEPSAMEPIFSKADPTKWKVVPSQIELGSVSDSDQTNFMQKSVRFSKDSLLTSIDYAAYLESSSDLVASDMEKLSASSSHDSVPSHGDIFQEKPDKSWRMAVMIPQPDNILDEEDIEEISLGEEK